MRSVLPAAVTPHPRCPCQWGPSGHCGAGMHERCPRSLGWHRHGQAEPETYVAGYRGGALAAVWRTGAPCRWLCPCACHSTVSALFAAPARGPRRGGHHRIASTDRLRQYDPDAPALFDLEVSGG